MKILTSISTGSISILLTVYSYKSVLVSYRFLYDAIGILPIFIFLNYSKLCLRLNLKSSLKILNKNIDTKIVNIALPLSVK